MVEKKSHNKVESFLSWVGIFTAVPADLLAIIPALINLLKTLGLIQGEHTKIPSTVFLISGIAIPIKAIVFVLIFYGYVASSFWFIQKIKYPHSRQDIFLGIKGLSTSIFSIFGIPFILSLVTFGILNLNKGLALSAIMIVISTVIWRRWDFHEDYKYKDVGISYLLWIPLTAMFLAFDSEIAWWWSLILAWFYASVGYLFSLMAVLGMLVYLRVQRGEWETDDSNNFLEDLVDNLGEIVANRVIFSFDQGILPAVLALIIPPIGIIAGYINLGLFTSHLTV